MVCKQETSGNKALFKYMDNVMEFQNQLNDISKTWDHLILLSQLGNASINMSTTKTNFNDLTKELIENLSNATLNKVVNEMKSKSSVTVDIMIRNLFERTADIGFLATDSDIREYLLTGDDLIKRMEYHKNDIDDTQYRIAKNTYQKSTKQLIDRFNEYVAKYSVYFDIVLFDKKGNIVAKLDQTNKIKSSTDDILDIALATSAEFVETFKYHDFLPQYEKSLVYTYKVKKSNDDQSVIGFLSLCFKFEDEMRGIFDRLINKTNKEVILLLDSDGVVIASSDKYHIPVGAKLDTEIYGSYKITQFAGRDYIVKSSKTNGYQGFFGLGWLGHLMIPLSSAFNHEQEELYISDDILYAIMQNERLFKKELLEIPAKASTIQDELDRAVWNGNIAQMDSKSSNVDFARSLLREVRHTGEQTKLLFNNSIEKLDTTIISSLLETTIFLASLAIDIMDRNLYERANDCRWWALTSTFKDILEKADDMTNIDKETMTKILEYINNLYTVYTNLFIYDVNGTILAVSNPKENNLVGTKLTDKWVRQTIALKDTSKYFVSPFEPTHLYKNQSTYIYNAVIKNNLHKSIGGIGIVFDSTPQFGSMLQDALPSSENTTSMFALFVEKETKKIISCTNDMFVIGDTLLIDNEFFTISEGKSLSKIIELNNKYYITGATCSSGYREYKSHSDDYINDVLAFVFIEASEANKHNKPKSQIDTSNYYTYHILPTDTVEEIATFYVGDKWLGVKQNEIIEAISIKNLEPIISLDSEHHFKGTISYKNYIVSVLDISPFIKGKISNDKNEIIIVKYKGSTGTHTIGIVVDKLGEVMKVPKQCIKPFEKHLIGKGMLSESIVQPPQNSETQKLLTLLNISKISTLGDGEANID